MGVRYRNILSSLKNQIPTLKLDNVQVHEINSQMENRIKLSPLQVYLTNDHNVH